MSFKIHKNNRITITAGDSAQINLRTFNKDSLPRFIPPRPRFTFNGLQPLRTPDGEVIYTDELCYDSEGNLLVDSEGNLINSEGDYIYPVYPTCPIDSEGHIFPTDFLGKGPLFRPMVIPSGFHQLQEEPLWPHSILRMRVMDLQGNLVLEKENDEYINTLFLDKEDTQYLTPGVYLYQVEYVTDPGTDTEEVQTIVDTAFFEVTKKFTVSEN